MNGKKEYLKYREILFKEPMSEKTREILTDFLRHLKNSNIAYTTQRNYTDSLVFFIRTLNKHNKQLRDLDGLKREDVYIFLDELEEYEYTTLSGKVKNYAEPSIQKHRLILRMLLKFLKKDDIAESISIKRVRNSKLPEDLLTPEEVDKLVEAADDPRDKAFIATLYESGARIGEMLSCKLNSVVFDENGCVITFPEGKTGPRRVRVMNASSYLRMWCDNHPYKDADRAETPLWVANRGKCRRASPDSLAHLIKNAAIKSGIKKKVNPHAFRHARATKLSHHLTEQQMKVYLGWSSASTMASVYVHLSGKDIDNAILKMNGQEPEDDDKIMKPGKCPRCQQMNHRSAPLCFMCGYPLKKGAEQTVEIDASKLQLLLRRLEKSDPELSAILSDERDQIQ